MKKLRKTALSLFTVLVLTLCTVLCASSISAAEVVASGNWGDRDWKDRVTWTLYDDGKLVVVGEGAIENGMPLELHPYEDFIKTVIIEDGITVIGKHAFIDCNSLTDITLPDSVTSIGVAAFSSCKKLSSITIPDSVTTIGEGAFFACSSLRSVNLGNGVTTIDEQAFCGCNNLTSITIPDSVTEIGDSAFRICINLTNITLGSSVASIDSKAFYGCENLTSVTVLSGDAVFGSSVFSGTHHDFTLYGYAGSTTDVYAAENGHTFEALEVPYDIDGNASFDIDDAILLFQHSMLPEKYLIPYTGNLDFSKDGTVDLNDAILLFRHIMMPDIYPLA